MAVFTPPAFVDFHAHGIGRISEGQSFIFSSHSAAITGGVALQSDGTVAGSVIAIADALKNYVNYIGMPLATDVNSIFANPLSMIRADEVLNEQSRELSDFVVFD